MDRNKENVTNNPKDVLKNLFIEAEKEGGLQYIFTLLRVTGITCCKDPLIKLESVLKKQEFSSSNHTSTGRKVKQLMASLHR